MDQNVSQQLAYLLAEAIDDKKFWDLVNTHEMELGPKRLPIEMVQQTVSENVDDALKLFVNDPGVKELLRDALMTALEGWYESHEGFGL